MTYDSWLEAPSTGSFIVTNSKNKSIEETIEYYKLDIFKDTKFARVWLDGGRSRRKEWFYIKEVVFPDIINNKKLDIIIHEI